MTLTVWLVVAAVCVVAGIVLLALDRKRRRPEPPAAEPSPDKAPEPPAAEPHPENAPEPGSLFRPNTPP